MSKYKLHNSVIKIIDTLKNEDLKKAVKNFINYTPIDFTVISNGAFRTSEQQNELFKKDPKVTNCDGYVYKSAHQSGLAIDLVPWVNNKPTWDLELARALGASFKTYCNMIGLNVNWGGDWNNNGVFQKEDFDPYHFEYINEK